jgi:hypothetical protein
LAFQMKAGDGAQLQRVIAEVAQRRRAWPSSPSDASSASSDE